MIGSVRMLIVVTMTLFVAACSKYMVRVSEVDGIHHIDGSASIEQV